MSLIFSGGRQKNPSVTADNLRNDDNAEIIVGLCEGPIVGLQDGKQSFFIDDTPLKSSTGEDNFEDYNLDIKVGDASQDESISLSLGGVAKGHNIGLELKEKDYFLVRQTDTANIDYIDVRIGIGSLYESDSKGNVNNATGRFRIEYRKSNSANWIKYGNADLYVTGKTTSTYVKDYRIAVERDASSGTYYEIRVTRLSEKSSESTSGYFFTMYFSQFEEVDASVKEFKNTAIAHLLIKTSDQVTSLPQLYGIYKLLKIKVPSNYDPELHTYNGLWDGTFKMAWTDNPAWCLYDLIVNDRYGVNAYYPVTADKWDFYEAGRYCDELVDDGRGGTEPRYTFNYLITESQSGPDMLNYIAATFNAVIYEDGLGLVRLFYEDNKKQAVQIFNPTNITSGGFNYTFSDPSNRYNEFTVTFLNPDLNWREDRRRVTEPYGTANIETYGRIPYDFNAIGCIKESEAIRKTRFKLITSLKETMTVSFATNRAATNINLFDTILIADPDMNYAQSGRIKSISEDRSTIYLRDKVFLEAGSLYEVNVQTPYSVFTCGVINNEYGSVNELKLDNYLPDDVYEKAVFTLSGTDSIYGAPKPFRVVSISENQGNPDEITIVATEIHRLKQDEADTGVQLEDESDYYNALPNYSIIPQVLDVNFKEMFNTDRMENSLIIGVNLDWDKYPYYTGEFEVYSRLKDSDNEAWTKRLVENGDTIFDHPSGLYEFKVLPKTTLGLYPSFDSAPIFEFDVSEVAAENPDKVQNFVAEGNIENIKLSWDLSEDAQYYEIRLGEDWDTADIVAETISRGVNEFYYTNVDNDNTYKFMIKAINIAGLYSEYPSIAYGSLSAPKDVKRFYITPNLDSLRFDWQAEEENYVSYEVRTGGSWDSGTTLFTTMGNNQTVLNPGLDENTYFYIKALSRKGIYSENALIGKIKQNLKQNRNVVLKVDNAKGKLNYYVNSDESYNQNLTEWFGVTKGLVSAPGDTKAMSDNYYNAEHFFPIHLPRQSTSGEEDTIARNWYDVEFFRYGQRLTWEDLDWTWDSDEAQSTSWLNEQDAVATGGKIDLLITTAKDKSEYGGYLGLPFNNTTTDLTGEIIPTVEHKVLYSDGKFDKGLLLYKLLKLKYNLVDLPTTFSYRFKVYLNANTPKDKLKLIGLSNAGGSIWMNVYIENNTIEIERSDGVTLRSEFTYRKYLDYLNVMITQKSDKLILDYSVEYDNITNRAEIDCEPLGNYNNLYFGSRYDY